MKKQKLFIGVILISLLLALLTACGESNSAPVTAPAEQKISLKLGLVTPIIDYWAIYIAQSNNLFEKNNLAVELTYFETASKVTQALSTGSLDLAVSTPDTTINAIEKGAGLTQVAGVYHKATYSFIVQKNIKSFNDLKGQSLAVSDLKDASTLLLLKMLEANGLKKGDYNLIPLGGTGKRAAAITGGQVAGALIGMPNNFVLEGEGYPSLGYTSEAVKEYQFNALAVQKEWVQKNSPALVRYLKSVNEASNWLYNPANKDAAIAILAKNLKVSQEIATKAYDLSVTRLQAFPRAGEINLEGYKAVIELMGELELLKAPLPSPEKYIDNSYLNKARQS